MLKGWADILNIMLPHLSNLVIGSKLPIFMFSRPALS